jgi:hypothetical protein
VPSELNYIDMRLTSNEIAYRKEIEKLNQDLVTLKKERSGSEGQFNNEAVYYKNVTQLYSLLLGVFLFCGGLFFLVPQLLGVGASITPADSLNAFWTSLLKCIPNLERKKIFTLFLGMVFIAAGFIVFFQIPLSDLYSFIQTEVYQKMGRKI